METFKIYFLVLLLLVIGSCKPDDESPGNNDGNGLVEMEPVTPTGTEQYLSLKSDYIFDQDKLHTLDLEIPEDNLEFLDADPTAEEYVEGKLTFEGETISPVGVRYKGSVGAFIGCVGGGVWWSPSGRKTCTKLSMKIKINWLDSDLKFYGLKKLQLHSMNNDESQMRERLGYWLFQEMEVPTPRCVHVRLKINGTFVGLFALVEQIDGRFARHHFDDGSGNLYKEVWPLTANGTATPTAEYFQALKTNEDENPSVEIIDNFAKALESANASTIPNVIDNWMKIDEIMTYAAVDRTIRHDDGPFHWYCSDGECSNHNYYWYEHPENQTLHLIPWDLDHAFGNIISSSNAVTYIPDEWGATSNNCAPFQNQFFQIHQRSAACDKLTAGWVSFDELYQEKLQAFKQGPLSIAQANMQIDKWTEQIRGATLLAAINHNDAISENKWEKAISALKEQLDFARNH